MRTFFGWLSLSLFLAGCPLPAPAVQWITNSTPERALTASNLVNVLNLNFASINSEFGGFVNAMSVAGVTNIGAGNQSTGLQNALNAAAGKTLVIPKGTYIAEGLTVPSNTRIIGDGTLRFPANTTNFWILKPADGASNVVIEGITLDGNISGQTTWSEFRHLIKLADASGVTIRNVRFTAPVGDCVYVSHVDDPLHVLTPYTGSSDVAIENCTFSGTSSNRNGISFACAKDVKVIGNTFDRMARPDMPGAIDLEPDHADEFIYNVTIAKNHFIGHASPDLQQGIVINNNVGAPIRGVTFEGNIFEGTFRYPIAVFGNPTTPDLVKIAGNTIRNSSYTNAGGIGILVSHCVADITGNTLDAPNDVGIKVLSGCAAVKGNVIQRAGEYAVFVGVSSAAETMVIDNEIIDAGYTSSNPARGGIYLEATGVDIANNRISSSSTNYTLQGIFQAGGTLNRIHGNRFSGIGSKNFNFTSSGIQLWGLNVPDKGVVAFDSVDTACFPPTTGSWQQGTVIWNPAPTGYNAPVFWVCSAAGTPGTWIAMPTTTSVSTNLNFPSILAGSFAELYVTFPGALPADVVNLGIESTVVLASQGIVFKTYCQADSVAVRAENHSAGAVDLPSGTFKIMLAK